MDSYIVRIYRRTASEKGEEVAGLVEEVGSGQKRSFRSYAGLLASVRQVIGKGEKESPGIYKLHAGREAVSK